MSGRGGRRRTAIPQTVICRACAVPFVWDGGSPRKPHYCKDAACRRTRQTDAAYRYFLAHRAAGQRTPRLARTPPPLPMAHTVYTQEPADHVERLLRAATARRKRREAVEGRTLRTDPWAQRPGVTSVDPEVA